MIRSAWWISFQFLPAAKPAGQWMIFVLSFFRQDLSNRALERPEKHWNMGYWGHWVHLRSLEAIWRSFEAVWRPFGCQRSITRGRKHNRGLLAACLSCLSKAASFEVIWGHLEAVLRPNMTNDSKKKFTKIEKHFIYYISLHRMLIFYCPARRRFYRAIAL